MPTDLESMVAVVAIVMAQALGAGRPPQAAKPFAEGRGEGVPQLPPLAQMQLQNIDLGVQIFAARQGATACHAQLTTTQRQAFA
jgi:hypothetical protein